MISPSFLGHVVVQSEKEVQFFTFIHVTEMKMVEN